MDFFSTGIRSIRIARECRHGKILMRIEKLRTPPENLLSTALVSDAGAPVVGAKRKNMKIAIVATGSSNHPNFASPTIAGFLIRFVL